MEAERQEEGARAGEVHRAKREAHAALKKLDKELRALLAEQPAREAARQEAAAEKLTAVRRRAKAELDVKELHERLLANTEVKVLHCTSPLDEETYVYTQFPTFLTEQ